MYRPLRYPHVAYWVRRRIFQFGVQRNFWTVSPEARVVTIDVDRIVGGAQRSAKGLCAACTPAPSRLYWCRLLR